MSNSLLRKVAGFLSVVTYRFLLVTLFILLGMAPVLADSDNVITSSPHVLFLNPGEPVDRGKGLFWPLTASLMGIAADSFGIELEVLYAERDHLLMLRQAESVSQRPVLPDYIIMVNEKQMAPEMLKLFQGTQTKILLIHNDLTQEQRREIGNERGQMGHWIGTAVTDEASGTYRMMEELYRLVGTEEPLVVGITGSISTPVSQLRAQGVKDFIEESGRGVQLQLTYGNWGSDDAENKANVLLGRYPQANIIWAANYSMALGALRAVKDKGAPVLVGSTAVAPYSGSDLILSGTDINVSLGSHFFIGAWAMVMLYDYHRGLDFADLGGPRLELDYLHVINSENAPRYYQIVYEETDKLDFSVFSRFLHPASGGYDFSLARLMSGE